MTYNMNIEQIKSLLARFYEGQTTPEEERQLADFFRREDVPEDLQEDKQLFLLLAQTSDQEMPRANEDTTTYPGRQTAQRCDLPFENTSEDVVSRSGNGGYSSRDRWRHVRTSAADISNRPIPRYM